MGYSDQSNLPPEIEDLAEKYRDEFPVTRLYTYLNHAAVAPLTRSAAEAMKWLAQDSLEHGTAHYDAWMNTCERLRANTAALVNAQPEEIALVKNTSEGIATVANGLDWKPGDKVVAFREEFPANYYCWKLLADRGVTVEWLSAMDPLDAIDEACRGARLLAISFVQYLSGYRAPLEAIGEICRRRGCLFFVDAIQGLGAFPVDVRSMGIHALAADGHKWMLGPEGCGVLYIAREIQDSIRPVEFGWTNTAHWADYASRGHDAAPRRRTLRVRDAEHDRLLRAERLARVPAHRRNRERGGGDRVHIQSVGGGAVG